MLSSMSALASSRAAARIRAEVRTLLGEDIGETSYPPRPSPKHSMLGTYPTFAPPVAMRTRTLVE